MHIITDAEVKKRELIQRRLSINTVRTNRNSREALSAKFESLLDIEVEKVIRNGGRKSLKQAILRSKVIK